MERTEFLRVASALLASPNMVRAQHPPADWTAFVAALQLVETRCRALRAAAKVGGEATAVEILARHLAAQMAFLHLAPQDPQDWAAARLLANLAAADDATFEAQLRATEVRHG